MNERFGVVANARNAWPSADVLAQLGARWVRTIVYSFDDLDSRLVDHPPDVHVIALLNTETDGVGHDGSGWGQTVQQFADRFAGRIQAVECLNEWDLLGYQPEAAVDAARIAAPILVNAGIGCLLGSVASGTWFAALEQAAALLTPDERAMLAGACFHPYVKSAHGFPAGFKEVGGELGDAVNQAHQIIGLPLYLTEYGIKISDAGGDDGQAAYFRGAYEILREFPPEVVAAACYFAWHDAVGAPSEQEEHAFGLVRPDDTHRPAYDVCCELAASEATFAPPAFSPAPPGARRARRRGRAAERRGPRPALARDTRADAAGLMTVFGHTGPFTVEELEVAAFRVAEWAPLVPISVFPGAATFKHWLSNKEAGTAATGELHVADSEGGGVAVITMAGRILRWSGGDTVEVL